MALEVVSREGVFVLSLYADNCRSGRRGEIKRMMLFPGGAVTGAEMVAVVQHLVEAQAELLGALLERFQEVEQGGALDEDGLPAGESVGGQGSRFDATA